MAEVRAEVGCCEGDNWSWQLMAEVFIIGDRSEITMITIGGRSGLLQFVAEVWDTK